MLALWWKTYGDEVRNEIRKLRNRCGFQVKMVVQSSKYTLCDLMSVDDDTKNLV